MKLLLCGLCSDVIKLSDKQPRTCECGACGGKYLNQLDAVWWGSTHTTIPLGFNNSSLADKAAQYLQGDLGSAQDRVFEAFVMPYEVATYKHIEREAK